MAKLISVIDINPTKHFVIDDGKIISQHRSFYLAQCAVERHLRKNKISNNYQIVSENND